MNWNEYLSVFQSILLNLRVECVRKMVRSDITHMSIMKIDQLNDREGWVFDFSGDKLDKEIFDWSFFLDSDAIVHIF